MTWQLASSSTGDLREPERSCNTFYGLPLEVIPLSFLPYTPYYKKQEADISENNRIYEQDEVIQAMLYLGTRLIIIYIV